MQPIKLPLVERTNTQIFKTARILKWAGVVILLLTIFLTDIGLVRSILIGVSILLMGLPFVLKFFIDDYKKLGIVRLHPDEITIKYKNKEAQVFSVDTIENFTYKIDSFAGESKSGDLLTLSGRMTVRSGAENTMSWISNNQMIDLQFQLNGPNMKIRTEEICEKIHEDQFNRPK